MATPGDKHDAKLASSDEATRLVLLSILVKMILIAHVRLLVEVVRRMFVTFSTREHTPK